MFPARYFAKRFYPADYFASVGQEVVVPDLPLHLPAPATPVSLLSAGGLATNNPEIE